MSKEEKIEELIRLTSELLRFEYLEASERELDKCILQIKVTLETLKQLKGDGNDKNN